MEKFKIKKILESLENIAFEKGAYFLTSEAIEQYCMDNNVEPEDFKNFIRKRIDIQELKKLSSESLDQVAGGTSTFNRGLASLLTATSLLSPTASLAAKDVNAGNSCKGSQFI